MDATLLNLLRPEVPAELAAIVAKMMAKEPERRFQTPADVAQALAHFFKKGHPRAQVQAPEVSQVGLPAARAPLGDVRSPSTQPETNPAPAAPTGRQTVIAS